MVKVCRIKLGNVKASKGKLEANIETKSVQKMPVDPGLGNTNSSPPPTKQARLSEPEVVDLLESDVTFIAEKNTADYMCKICGQRFRHRFGLNRHLYVLHPEQSMIITKEKKRATSNTMADRHISFKTQAIQIPESSFNSQSIPAQEVTDVKDFNSKISRQKQMVSKSSSKPKKGKKCLICMKFFKDKVSLIEHFAQQHVDSGSEEEAGAPTEGLANEAVVPVESWEVKQEPLEEEEVVVLLDQRQEEIQKDPLHIDDNIVSEKPHEGQTIPNADIQKSAVEEVAMETGSLQLEVTSESMETLPDTAQEANNNVDNDNNNNQESAAQDQSQESVPDQDMDPQDQDQGNKISVQEVQDEDQGNKISVQEAQDEIGSQSISSSAQGQECDPQTQDVEEIADPGGANAAHETESEEEPEHQCDQCLDLFHSKAAMLEHFRKAHLVSDRCDRCHTDILYPDTKMRHYRRAHFDHLLHCGDCSFNCISDADLEAHKDRSHRLNFVCRECGKVLKTKITLDHHVNAVHKKIYQVLCDLCGAQFFNKATLKLHMAAKHGARKPASTADTAGGRWMCELCGAVAQSQGKLIAHQMKQHSNDSILECALCKQRLSTLKGLKLHMTRVHGQSLDKDEILNRSRGNGSVPVQDQTDSVAGEEADEAFSKAAAGSAFEKDDNGYYYYKAG